MKINLRSLPTLFLFLLSTSLSAAPSMRPLKLQRYRFPRGTEYLVCEHTFISTGNHWQKRGLICSYVLPPVGSRGSQYSADFFYPRVYPTVAEAARRAQEANDVIESARADRMSHVFFGRDDAGNPVFRSPSAR